MLTTNMTNRQKVDFYRDLYDRANRLYEKTRLEINRIFENNDNAIADFISSLVGCTEWDADYNCYETKNLFWFDSDIKLMKRIAFWHKLNNKALVTLARISKKFIAAREKAKEDEANN